MKPNPPPELENYRYDRESSQTPGPVRMIGWLSLVVFAVAVYSTFFLSGEQMILMRSTSYVGFAVLFSAYVVGKIMTRHSRCSQCRRVMDDIDVQWTPDTWQQIQGYELMGSVTGADGKLYTIEREKKAGSTTYFIYAHFQQWCACHQCRVYFLKAQYWQKRLFSTIDEDEFERAKHSLLTDPDARAQMEAAYEAFFQKHQKSQ